MEIPNMFVLLLPFILMAFGMTIANRGAEIAFYLMAAFSAFVAVAYPQLATASNPTSIEYTTGIVYLAIGITAIILAVVATLEIEGERR